MLVKLAYKADDRLLLTCFADQKGDEITYKMGRLETR